MQINFIHIPGYYGKVLDSLINPIREHLPESKISRHAIKGVNVNFFVEDSLVEYGPPGSKSVFMSHGIADKKWRDAHRVKDFDYVCVSGPLWVDKYIKQGLPKEKIVVVGYTKLDPIFQGKVKTDEQLDQTHTLTKVLWAPTHNMGSKSSGKPISSYPFFEKYLSSIPANDFVVQTALHPANQKKEARTPTVQGLTWADIVISDSGSLVYEAMILGKPVVFPDWICKDNILGKLPNTFIEKIYNEKIGYHARDINHLIELLYKARDNGIDQKSIELAEGILPTNLRGKSGKAMADKLKEIALSN